MPARFSSAVCTTRTTRLRCIRSGFGALIGILALLMQMLPALANSEDGTWIEICSDLGPVMMQIGANGDFGEESDCPECEDCTLCATAAASTLANDYVIPVKSPAIRGTGFVILTNTRETPRHLRPVTRGPPQGEEQSAACMPRLSLALIPLNGGAPWI